MKNTQPEKWEETIQALARILTNMTKQGNDIYPTLNENIQLMIAKERRQAQISLLKQLLTDVKTDWLVDDAMGLAFRIQEILKELEAGAE